jgi:lysophospholipase L1-like esterase
MPFGDSITEGAGYAGGYRVELFHLAHQAGKNITFVGSQSNGPAQVDGIAFPVHHEGHGGYTIDNASGHSGISPLVSSVMPTYTPNIITLMIGTNDATYSIDMPNAPKRLGNLIDSIFAQLPNVLLIVAQPTPTRDDNINSLLQPYNAAIPAIVKTRADAGKHIRILDMWPVLANHSDYKTTLLGDTWHPTSAGYALLGDAWYGAISDAL